MDKQYLKEIIIDQNKRKIEENLLERDKFKFLEKNIKNPFVVIISGIRRAGKSTLLNQLRAKYPGYYINFDDDRLIKFGVEDFQALFETFLEIYGEMDIFYFDEIQNIEGWERFVRRLRDLNKKVFITGSNASMLSRELGSKLTGRHLNINLFPFSFNEFLRYKGIKLDSDSIYQTEIKAKIKRYFREYFFNGGFPEYVKTQNIEYLKTLYENILYRDIIVRNNLSNERTFKELVYLAITSLSKEISFNSIKKSLNLGSSTTVREYFNYLEDSYLMFLVPKFDYSFKKQIYSSKKVYVVDNGLANYLGYKVSGDFGKLLENLVFLELRRENNDIYYFQNKYECDFVIKEGVKVKRVIQVCYDFNEGNKDRELDGLINAMDFFKLKEGEIITYDEEDEIKIGNKKIFVKPIWKWLLDK